MRVQVQQPSFEAGYRDPLWKPASAVEAELTPEPELPTALPPLIVPPHRDFGALTKKLTAPAWNCLAALRAENEEQTQRKSALLAAASEFARELETLLAAAHASKVARLTVEHEQASEACRQQLSAADAAKLAVTDYQATLRTVNGRLSRANAELKSWLGREPDLNNFPTAEDVAIWRKGKLLREQDLEKCELEQGDVFAEDRRLRGVVMKELGKLRPLQERELLLRNELSGDEFFDVEFGLKHVPEV